MTVHLGDSAVELVPQATVGELWYLKSWREAGKAGLSVGNFTAITLQPQPLDHSGGGQSCWVELNLPEIRWIQQINTASVRTWGWACENVPGTLYLGTHDDEYQETTVRWPRIALGSPDTSFLSLRNQVRVLEYSGDHRYARIEGIPRSADYSRFAARRDLVLTAYTVYPDGRSGEEPLYRMPLFDPSTFKSSLGGTGLWLETSWLHSRV